MVLLNRNARRVLFRLDLLTEMFLLISYNNEELIKNFSNEVVFKKYFKFISKNLSFPFFQEYFDFIMRKEGLKYVVIQNALTRIDQMIQQLSSFELLVITKFMNRIWIKHKKCSDFGEKLIDLNHFLGLKPEFVDNFEQIIAERLNESEPSDKDLQEIDNEEGSTDDDEN